MENKYRDIVFCNDEISSQEITNVINNILEINWYDDQITKEIGKFKRSPIRIYISSYGGDVYKTLGLIDIITNSKTPVYTYCTGIAMSAGLLIAISGKKRFCYKHSTFMMHEISSWLVGKISEITEDLDQMNKLQNLVTNFIVSKTKITKKQLEKMYNLKKDWYVFSKEALSLGICDKIIK